MTINIIDKKMIVQNKIELHPSINYISASSDCNFLQELDISEAGVYGFVNTSNITWYYMQNTIPAMKYYHIDSIFRGYFIKSITIKIYNRMKGS